MRRLRGWPCYCTVVEQAYLARRRLGVADLIVTWGRPLLSVCAVVTMAVWAGEWLSRLHEVEADSLLAGGSSLPVFDKALPPTSTTNTLEVMAGLVSAQEERGSDNPALSTVQGRAPTRRL